MQFEVTIEKAGFKGKAMIDFPTREEKYKLLAELKTLGYGKGKDASESQVEDNQLALASKMGEVVEQRLISFDVIFEETGTQINDKALLDIYSEGQVLIGVISHYILGGVSLGKEKS